MKQKGFWQKLFEQKNRSEEDKERRYKLTIAMMAFYLILMLALVTFAGTIHRNETEATCTFSGNIFMNGEPFASFQYYNMNVTPANASVNFFVQGPCARLAQLLEVDSK